MNNKTCAMCGASMDANAQVCPTCGFQQSQQPQAYQMGAQQPVQQQPVQPAQPAQPVQQQMMYDPNTGQPLQQQSMNQQTFGNVQQPVVQQQPIAQPVLPQQLQQPFGGAQNQPAGDGKEQSPVPLIGGFALILIGWFIAGLICSGAALSIGLSYKGKSPLKWVLVVLAGIELAICILGLAASAFA